MGGRALKSAIFAAVMALSPALPAFGADQKPFAVDCYRLSRRERHELAARVQLLLRSLDEAPPRRIVLVCDRESAWLEWDGPPEQEFEIDESAGLVEGALDAIENRARTGSFVTPPSAPEAESHGSRANAGAAQDDRVSPPPPRGPLVSTRNEVPSFARPEPPASARRGTIGGAGLSLVIEPVPGASPGVGPRLDVGVGLGPLAFIFNEGGGTDASTFMMMDLAMGVGLGAPFDPNMNFGVIGTGGLEWVTGYGDTPRSSDVSRSAVFTLGVRGAAHVTGASFWCGLDGRLRTNGPRVGPDALEIPGLTAMISVGGALLVDGFLVSSRRYASR